MTDNKIGLTDSEILQKAINKAVANGYSMEAWFNFNDEDMWPKLIFSHGFARFFWKDECLVMESFPTEMRMSWSNKWKGFLQQMVTEENPIKYLERFL